MIGWHDTNTASQMKVAGSKIQECYDYFFHDFLCHIERLSVFLNSVNAGSTLLWSFWWLNEKSTSTFKRAIGHQSLRKVMNLKVRSGKFSTRCWQGTK